MKREKIGHLIMQAQQWLQQGGYDKAIAVCRTIIKLDRENSDGYHFWGLAEHARGNFQEALRLLTKAVKLDPFFVAYLNSLGMAYHSIGNNSAAAEQYQKALVLSPGYLDAHLNLGNLYAAEGDWTKAGQYYQRAVGLKPGSTKALNGLGLSLSNQGHLEQAEKMLRQALVFRPDYTLALNNLRRVAAKLCDIETMIEVAQTLLRRNLKDINAWGIQLMASNYCDDLSPDQLYAQYVEFGKQFEAINQPVYKGRNYNPQPEKRLKIGYVTPDLHSLHPVMTFMQGVFRHHSRQNIEVFCYSTARMHDQHSDDMKGLVDHWVASADKSHQQLAEEINKHEIDILVDLAGHTFNSSLPVFMMKPAPVQVTWLGYPNTTGVKEIDYRLTDAIADPPGDADQVHTEKLWRLPDCFLNYSPPDYAPEVAAPPSVYKGSVTFGSFNNPNKLSLATIKLWSQLLQENKTARLLLKGAQFVYAETRQRFEQLFAEHGVEPERLELRGQRSSVVEHLAMYAEVDIALDPFPYNGTTTTCEALWMGVPVVTLAGERHAARVGASILTNVGRPELISYTHEEYVNVVTGLIQDQSRLVRLRNQLREDVRMSNLCDAASFIKKLEDAYRTMWRIHCSSESDDVHRIKN
jgi:predicted O-linked N-acetylglucosamine transferase (SPINDLY family)